MVRTTAVELAPIRVNALHRAVVDGDRMTASIGRRKPSEVLEALTARTKNGL